MAKLVNSPWGGVVKLTGTRLVNSPMGGVLFEAEGGGGPATLTSTVSVTLPSVTTSVTGTAVTTLTATVDVTLPSVTTSATGTAVTTLTATVDVTLPSVFTDGTLTITPQARTAVVSVTLPSVICNADGDISSTLEGTWGVTLQPVDVLMTGMAITPLDFVIGATLQAVVCGATGLVVDPDDMSNYVKTTDFAVKDTYPTGTAAKRVSGAELDVEFNNIATAIASKGNAASPTFTGETTITDLTVTTLNGGAGVGVSWEIDKATGNISRASALTKITRDTAAAVVYTMVADATAGWTAGDEVIIYCGDGVDVTINRAGTGVFNLPDGTTATSIQATTAGTIHLVNTAGDDNWNLVQQ